MSDDEVMRFEITDNDLEEEFNFNRRRPRMTKAQAALGIWAGDSDEDDDPDARPSFGGAGGNRRGGKSDYTAPVGFISAGFKKSAKEEEEDLKKKKEAGGAGGSKDSDDDGGDSDNDTFSAGLGFKKAKKRPKLGGGRPQMMMGSGQIAGMRTAGYNQPMNLGKGFGDWEKHTKGIGAKLLLQMGYEAGKGLGKNLQGRSEIVEAHLRKGRGAIGAYGKEKSRPKIQAPDSEEEEEREYKEKLHQWKKGGPSQTKSQQKVKYVYKSADQVLEDGKWRQTSSTSGEPSKVKIIDMTGKEQRVLSSYHAIGAQKMLPDEDDEEAANNDNKSVMAKKVVNFDLPELRHNIDLLLDQCEEELISTDRSLKHHKNKVEVLQQEEEKIAILLDRESKQIGTLKSLLERVEEFEAKHQEGSLNLDTAKDMLHELQKSYPDEYRSYELPYIAMTIVTPLLKARLSSSWNPLENPGQNLGDFQVWRELLELNKYQGMEPMDPFHNLLWETWMPSTRIAITSWDTRQPDKLISFLDTWRPLLPSWMATNILEHVLLPKLQAAVEMWNPLTDAVPIHSWLHPWLPMLGDQLGIVYPTIRNKLASALNAWHPSDRSAKLILLPWKDIFDNKSMNTFILKNILPKLTTVLASELVINPVNQNLDPWGWVMEWKDFLPPAAMINLLERHFFTKWLSVLANWLNTNPNCKEVTDWYKGWKSMIPPELVNTPQVQHQLQQALDMMTRTVAMSSGHPMSRQPGAPEAMMYLNTTERGEARPPHQGPTSAFKTVNEAVATATKMASAPGNMKELITMRCEERGILFRPVPSRFQEGKQVYRCGSSLIYTERNAIFVQDKDKWIPTSLNSLLDSAAMQ